jgi:hypothetical protein
MTYLLVTLILLLAAFSLSYLIRSSLLISLPTSIFGITAVLYVFSLFDQLLLGFWVVLATIGLATMASAVLLIKDKELVSHLKTLLSPGLAIFLALALFSYLLTRGMQLSSWDEFSHWGTIVKATFLYDAVGPYNPVELGFRSYPPSLSLFEYFVTKLGGPWLEGNIFFAYQLIIWSLFTPFLAQLTWRNWGQLIAVVPLVFVAPLAFFNSMNVTLIDPLLGMLFGYALAIAYVGNILQWRLALHVGLAIFMLTLAKDAGTFMASLVVVLFIVRLLAAKRNAPGNLSWKNFGLLASMPLLSLILSNQSWAALVAARVESPSFQNPIDIGALFGVPSGEGPGHWQEVISTFGFGVSNFPINSDGVLGIPQLQLIILFAILLSGFEWFVSRRMGRPFGLALIGTVTVGAILYTYGLLVLYLFRFGAYEAVRLASYERYLSTYWAGIALFVALVSIWLVAGRVPTEPAEGAKGKTEGAAEMAIAGAVFLSLFALSPVQKLTEFFSNPHAYSSQVRSQFDPVLEKVKQAGISANDRIWIIAQHTTGFEYWVLRYSLMESQVGAGPWSIGSPADAEDVWTTAFTAAEWAQELKDYDYVVIYRATESFAMEFGELFQAPNSIESSKVFRVASEGGSVSLISAGE